LAIGSATSPIIGKLERPCILGFSFKTHTHP